MRTKDDTKKLFLRVIVSASKELRHDILSPFFKSLNNSLSVGKPKYNGLLRKKNSKGMIVEQKGTRMAEDGED